jgi:hypothetical protein
MLCSLQEHGETSLSSADVYPRIHLPQRGALTFFKYSTVILAMSTEQSEM